MSKILIKFCGNSFLCQSWPTPAYKSLKQKNSPNLQSIKFPEHYTQRCFQGACITSDYIYDWLRFEIFLSDIISTKYHINYSRHCFHYLHLCQNKKIQDKKKLSCKILSVILFKKSGQVKSKIRF